MINFSSEDVFVVTGASSGIGKELALKLNELGATVVAVARSLDKMLQIKVSSKNPERFCIEQKDLTENVENLPDFIKYLKDKYGKIRGLACVAGVDKVVPMQMLSKRDIEHVFLINYTVPMLLTKGFIDKRNNVGEGANILYIASMAGVNPDKGQAIYGASKAALINSSIVISKEIATRNMRCNCISPAWVNTPMFENQNTSIGVSLKDYALGLGEPSDIANLGVYLMSDKAKWISGENYKIGSLKC